MRRNTYCTTSTLLHKKNSLFWDCFQCSKFQKLCSLCAQARFESSHRELLSFPSYLPSAKSALEEERRLLQTQTAGKRREEHSFVISVLPHLYWENGYDSKIWHHVQTIRKCCFTIIMMFIEVTPHWPCFISAWCCQRETFFGKMSHPLLLGFHFLDC